MSSWASFTDVGRHQEKIFSELEDHLIAYQSGADQWFKFPIIDAAKNWSKCLFETSTCSLEANDALPIFFLFLEATGQRTFSRTELKLLDFIRYLRLSKYHPQALSTPDYALWGSPVVCFSYEPKESILCRKPEGLILFAPSVLTERLPMLLQPSLLGRATRLPAAKADELVKFVNSTKPVNLSSNHHLGDVIGPYSMLKSINAGTTLQAVAAKSAGGTAVTTQVEASTPGAVSGLQRILDNPRIKEISTVTLHEMLWQEEQGKDSKEDVNPAPDIVADLVKNIQALPKRKQILIVDDQDSDWSGVWEKIFGQEGKDWVRGYSPSTLKKLATKDDCREYQMLILDLRLKDDDKNKPLEEISGYQFLQIIRKSDQAVPVLMFTSSRRGAFLQGLRWAGADSVCLKPVRVDTAPALLENFLNEILLLLSPEYELLQSIYYELKDKEKKIKSRTGDPAPVRWARAAWIEARQNVRLWLTQKNIEQVRLTGVSVARTAGLAAEAIKDKAFDETQTDNHPYFNALKSLRNDASHIGPEESLCVEVGFIAVTLVNKLILTLNNKYTGLSNPNVLLNSTSVSESKLGKVLPLTRIPSDSRQKIWGSIQVAILAHELNAEQNVLGLSGIAPYLVKLETTASQTLERVCKENKISKIDLQPFISTYSTFQPWFDTLNI